MDEKADAIVMEDYRRNPFKTNKNEFCAFTWGKPLFSLERVEGLWWDREYLNQKSEGGGIETYGGGNAICDGDGGMIGSEKWASGI